MRHKKKTLILSRKVGPRTALIRTLAMSFIEHERIQTTPAKAKALREFVEPLVTIAKEKSPQSIRLIEKKLSNKKAVVLTLVEDLKKKGKLEESIRATTTTGISRKNTELMELLITETLKQNLKKEFK